MVGSEAFVGDIGSGERNWKVRASGLAVVTALTVGLGGCSSVEGDIQTADQACVASNARTLPSKGDVASVKDERFGKVFPCEYLLDMRIPYAMPGGSGGEVQEAPLVRIATEQYDSPSFKLSGSLGGWAILGSGMLSGDVSAEGGTERKRLTIVTVEDLEGSEQMLILDSEKVRVKKCSEDSDCTPSLRVTVSDQPLFVKYKENDMVGIDDHSIWYNEDLSIDEQPGKVSAVRAVSNCLPTDEHEGCTGGPKTTGEVISALASSVVITVPEKSEFATSPRG